MNWLRLWRCIFCCYGSGEGNCGTVKRYLKSLAAIIVVEFIMTNLVEVTMVDVVKYVMVPDLVEVIGMNFVYSDGPMYILLTLPPLDENRSCF
jgi:hypothetical protein